MLYSHEIQIYPKSATNFNVNKVTPAF